MKSARPQTTETSARDKADYTSLGRAPSSLPPSATSPVVTGQCAEVLTLIRQHQPLLSFVLTADHAIPEAAARVHDLRCMGWNIITRIVPSVKFRGRIRRNAALYSLGVPDWPYPGFVTGKEGGGNVE